MNYFKEQDIEEPYPCPEKENFLDQEEVLKGYDYHPTREECIFNYKNGHCSGSCNQDFLEEITLHVIVEFIGEFGFKEFKTEETTEENGEIIHTTKAVKGVFTDEQRHIAIIHDCTYTDSLPENFSYRLQDVDIISDFLNKKLMAGYWLMSNNDITPSLYDQLNDSEKNKRFNVKTRIWSRNKFDIQYNLQKELFSSEFFED